MEDGDSVQVKAEDGRGPQAMDAELQADRQTRRAIWCVLTAILGVCLLVFPTAVIAADLFVGEWFERIVVWLIERLQTVFPVDVLTLFKSALFLAIVAGALSLTFGSHSLRRGQPHHLLAVVGRTVGILVIVGAILLYLAIPVF